MPIIFSLCNIYYNIVLFYKEILLNYTFKNLKTFWIAGFFRASWYIHPYFYIICWPAWIAISKHSIFLANGGYQKN